MQVKNNLNEEENLEDFMDIIRTINIKMTRVEAMKILLTPNIIL